MRQTIEGGRRGVGDRLRIGQPAVHLHARCKCGIRPLKSATSSGPNDPRFSLLLTDKTETAWRSTSIIPTMQRTTSK